MMKDKRHDKMIFKTVHSGLTRSFNSNKLAFFISLIHLESKSEAS